VSVAGALFSADTAATGHAALKRALQPHNRTLQLETYATIDEAVNHFDFIQSCEYLLAVSCTYHHTVVLLARNNNSDNNDNDYLSHGYGIAWDRL